jgi:hypothetical protein
MGWFVSRMVYKVLGCRWGWEIRQGEGVVEERVENEKLVGTR